MRKFLVLGSVVAMLAVTGLAFEFIQDYRNVRAFEYRISSQEGDVYYGVEIVPQGEFNEVRTTIRQKVPSHRALEMDQLMESFTSGWVFAFMNPFYSMLLGAFDLEAPQMLRMFGITLEEGGTQSVGQWTGQEYTLISQGEKLFTWVINPSIGIPLKTIFHSDNIVMELVRFDR